MIGVESEIFVELFLKSDCCCEISIHKDKILFYYKSKSKNEIKINIPIKVYFYFLLLI